MLGIATFIKTIISVILSFFLLHGISAATDQDPADAAEAFMKRMSEQQEQTLEAYMDNEYVNFFVNVEGDAKATDRLRENLFKNFSYEIEDKEEKDGLAVVKFKIKGNDFSKAMEEYEENSYDYVTENLYEEEVEDKEKLRAKCLELYVDEIEEEAGDGKVKESTVYLPLKTDEHGNWKVLLSDEIMKQLLGNIALPEGVIEEETEKKQ